MFPILNSIRVQFEYFQSGNMAQQENHNLAIDRYIEDLERDVERVRERICNNHYRAQCPREREAHLLALLLTTLAIARAMVVANVEEQMALLNLDNPGPGGNAN
ncbi:hypothetical protein CAEBREN_00134 [Caenorhabditis brenneri]|uniref:Uncharacterized protein n=1 Tax=Caenorhabditis brenneri TaxID=135651 RepID=G0P614_CAEBE|nr:hypothetical protein CAEBREN_00134 [Caenorhabditis brenneri]